MKYRILLVVGIVVAAFITLEFYAYIFAKNLDGEIVGVERVTQPTAVFNGGNTPIPNSQLFSFAIAIRDRSGEIFTASSEDRQWAVVQKGQCAHAKFFPYPPWNLDKAGTYHDARLLKLEDCPNGAPKSQVPQGLPVQDSGGLPQKAPK